MPSLQQSTSTLLYGVKGMSTVGTIAFLGVLSGCALRHNGTFILLDFIACMEGKNTVGVSNPRYTIHRLVDITN